MSAKSEKILRDFTQALTKPKGTTPYDTTAKVLRVENGIAWVHIAGGVDETPVKMTIDAKAGDTVQVRVSGGRAFLVGNATAPPTDDATANVANKRAVNADKKAGVAKQTAEEAQETADVADGKATEAKEIAEEAGEAVAEVAQHFWTDENGAHVTRIPQEDFVADPANGGGNTLIDSGGMKVRNGINVMADFGNNVELYTEEGVAAFSIDTGAISETTTITTYLNSNRIDVELNNSETRVLDELDDLANGQDFVFDYARRYEKQGGGQTRYVGWLSGTFTKGTSRTANTTSTYSDASFSVRIAYDGDKTVTVTITAVTTGTWHPVWFDLYYITYDKTAHRADVKVDGNLTVSKNVIFSSPNDVFVVERYTPINGVSVASKNYKDYSDTISKQGYYPVGVVGHSGHSRYTVPTRALLEDQTIGRATLKAMVANLESSAKTMTFDVDVLWVKAE